jgi:hypothetical protein
VEVLATPGDYYGNIQILLYFIPAQFAKGSYIASSYLISEVDASGNVSDYYRWLDMDNGVARTLWTQQNATFLRSVQIISFSLTHTPLQRALLFIPL